MVEGLDQFRPLPLCPGDAGWTEPQFWLSHDYKEITTFAPILWPEIGAKCTIILECVCMDTTLLLGSTGFWIIDVYLNWAGFVSRSWRETIELIQDTSLWAKAKLQEPTEENIVLFQKAAGARFKDKGYQDNNTVDEMVNLLLQHAFSLKVELQHAENFLSVYHHDDPPRFTETIPIIHRDSHDSASQFPATFPQ